MGRGNCSLTYKGYGRIYVLDPERVNDVIKIIGELDGYELSYMPKEMVAPWSEYPRVVYTAKFEPDTDALTATCFAKGIAIWIFDSGNNQFPESRVHSEGES